MKALEKRSIPKMNEHVTSVGFGALEIGRDWGLGTEETLLRPEDGEAEEVLQTVLDVGINLIDTASAYHRSEERIGRFLHDRRQEYLLASKCGEHSREPNTYYDYSYAGIAGSIDPRIPSCAPTSSTSCRYILDLSRRNSGSGQTVGL